MGSSLDGAAPLHPDTTLNDIALGIKAKNYVVYSALIFT
jgi:hypothetical protein